MALIYQLLQDTAHYQQWDKLVIDYCLFQLDKLLAEVVLFGLHRTFFLL